MINILSGFAYSIALPFLKYQQYFSGGCFGILMMLSIAWLYLHRNNPLRGQTYIMMISSTFILLFIALFLPTSWLIMKLTEIGIYWRVYWLLPFPAIIAYTGVELSGDEKRKKIILAFSLIALVMANGAFIFTDENFAERGNNYKLPEQVIEVADIINEYAEENGIAVKKVVGPDRVALNIRMYDTSIIQYYGRDMIRNYRDRTKLYYEINKDTYNIKKISTLARRAGCNFVILELASDKSSKMEKQGYIRIGEDLDYAVYYDPLV